MNREEFDSKYYEMEAEFNYFKSKLIEYKGQIIDSNLIEYRDPELVDGYGPLLEWHVATVTIPAVFEYKNKETDASE